MRSSALAFAVSFCLAAPAFAQTPPAASAAPAPAAVPAPGAAPDAAMTREGKPKAKEVRKECKSEAKAQGLKGEEKQKAVMDCVVKQRPDLAAKEQCRMDGKAKGLKKDELKSFVKACAKGKG